MVNVEWSEWGAAAFDRARSERKPVLLFIGTAWSMGSRDMDATSYAAPEVAAFINERFVPIRVDADARPDIAERYTLAGIPTTAFLDGNGAILGGGTYVASDRMLRVLEQASSAYPGCAATEDRQELPETGRAASAAQIVAAVFSSFDAEHGGFGVAPKFPLAAPLHLALDLWTETGDPAYREMVVRTLDRIGWGPLCDEQAGGFFHYAARPDWSEPSPEKLLASNAALIRLFLDAGARLGEPRFTDRAADALRFVQVRLGDADDGGWFACEEQVGRVQLVDAAAAMVSAALHAATVFSDDGLRQFALTSLERVLLSGYKPGHGAAHLFVADRRDPAASRRGFLSDQAAMAAANLDAFAVSGNVVYEMMAEELAHYALRVMSDEERGGFFDSVVDEEAVGLMRRRLKPFVTNCEFAATLARLAGTSGDGTFLDRARQTLAAMAPLAMGHGPLAAHWVLAEREANRRSGETLV